MYNDDINIVTRDEKAERMAENESKFNNVSTTKIKHNYDN